jgi:mRNA interferase HigB
MQIIAKRTLRQFWERHPRAKRPLSAWYSLVDKASWNGPKEVKAMFGNTVDLSATIA